MKIGVITPIGPGHLPSYEKARQSIEVAWEKSHGLFTSIEIIGLDDTNGVFGRSNRRNEGIRLAKAANCKWIFFLDADDLLAENAFNDVSPYLEKYDAIWGNICEMPYGQYDLVKLRENQLIHTEQIQDILLIDPFLTLQMGHFVKMECLDNFQFDEQLHTGEDFKYYLSICSNYKFIKSKEIFFINQRGNSATNSASGKLWRKAVEQEMVPYIKKYFRNRNALNLEGKTAVIVAHPDDEVLWAGGILSQYKDFDVIVCSIPKIDPNRALCFFNAMRLLKHFPILFPFIETAPTEPLNNLNFLADLIEKNRYQNILTHNATGEYGHLHHKQINSIVTNCFHGNLFFFGYGLGDIGIDLNLEEKEKKRQAIQLYNNVRKDLKGVQSWQLLENTLRIDYETEWYQSREFLKSC